MADNVFLSDGPPLVAVWFGSCSTRPVPSVSPAKTETNDHSAVPPQPLFSCSQSTLGLDPRLWAAVRSGRLPSRPSRAYLKWLCFLLWVLFLPPQNNLQLRLLTSLKTVSTWIKWDGGGLWGCLLLWPRRAEGNGALQTPLGKACCLCLSTHTERDL